METAFLKNTPKNNQGSVWVNWPVKRVNWKSFKKWQQYITDRNSFFCIKPLF